MSKQVKQLKQDLEQQTREGLQLKAQAEDLTTQNKTLTEQNTQVKAEATEAKESLEKTQAEVQMSHKIAARLQEEAVVCRSLRFFCFCFQLCIQLLRYPVVTLFAGSIIQKSRISACFVWCVRVCLCVCVCVCGPDWLPRLGVPFITSSRVALLLCDNGSCLSHELSRCTEPFDSSLTFVVVFCESPCYTFIHSKVIFVISA